MNTPQTKTPAVQPVANNAIDSILTTVGVSPQTTAKSKKQQEVELLPMSQTEMSMGSAAQKALASLTKEADGRNGQKTFEDWMKVATGYSTAKDYAMRNAGGKTAGRKYSKAYGEFVKRFDLGDDHLHKSTRSRLLKCYEHRAEIEEWRKNQDGRALNNPVLIWNAFKPTKPKSANTARSIAEQLTDRYGSHPKVVAAEVLKKRCRIDAKTHDGTKAKAVAEQLRDFVESVKEESRHDGHDFLIEVAKAIETIETNAAKTKKS